MGLDLVPTGKNPPDELNVIIEIPKDAEPVKYEVDKASGAIFVDRVLSTPMRYPCNYGYVPHTLCGDGDPADVLVLMPLALIPGSVIRVRPVGVLLMEDDKGGDEKLITVPVDTTFPYYSEIGGHDELPPIVTQQIEHFFQHYKDLEPGKWAKILGWGDAAKANTDIADLQRVTIADVQKVPMPAADAGSALIAGKVPVAVTYEPYLTLAMQQNNKVKMLYSAGENPGLISDVFVVREADQRAIAIECKYQGAQGTVDEKIPYALQDLEALWIPGLLVYAGGGWSRGVLHTLEGSRRAAYCLPDVADQVMAACGPEFTLENMAKIGERIWNMERDFNNQAGFTAKDDSLPPRLLNEACKTGGSKGKVSMLAEMMPKYYSARGWDSQGRPTADTKARLGL